MRVAKRVCGGFSAICLATIFAWLGAVAPFCHPATANEPPAVRLCEPWTAEYSAENATGDHVIALWQFNSGSETVDTSGHGHDLLLEDAEFVAAGRFGGGLRSARGWPVADERHRVRVKDADSLSPQGPFTIEMWICPTDELDGDYPSAFLVDKKYVADDDYQLILGAAGKYGARTLQACLGFGTESSTYHARPANFEPGTWYHLAFTYDGEGEGRFFLDGKPWGSQRVAGRKSISPGRHFLSIGDRVGSLYHGFPGTIDEVRICHGVLEFRSIAMEKAPGRTCFVRNEPQPTLRLNVTNLFPKTLGQAKVSIAMEGSSPVERPIEHLAAGQTTVIEYPLDVSLRPDAYRITAKVETTVPVTYQSEDSFVVRIVPRKLPHQFPVLMWGLGNPAAALEETDRLKQIGFTHVLGFGADYQKIFDAGEPATSADDENVEKTREMLDEALASGLTVVASLSPGAAMRSKPQFRRVGRDGKAYEREDICGLFPELQDFCYNVGASVAKTYGDYPAWGAAMLHTEVRDHANPCFHDLDRQAFRDASGFDIPAEVSRARGVDYTKLPDFPASRVIPDDHPLYVYYRWYWKEGDGWNALNSRLNEGLKSTGRTDVWTYHDPAVRVASVYGSGGNVDVLSQWTYSYPDPIRIAVATDELLAMAAGASRSQQVMKMTQIIWYRSQTAPMPKPADGPPAHQARWEQEQPDAPFITIAPMHLREAFWTKISRPIRGIMYHGWQSLVLCDPPRGYRFTNPETQHELARLIREVVRPLGPTLLQVPAVKGDVAFLESFASEMFARRGTFGWGGSWAGDAYHLLLYAHLQPTIVFDETIAEGGLDGFRVLVMPDCDVITETMAARIKAFQSAGGLVVGDDRLAPAITPDIRLTAQQRTGRAKTDKRVLVKLATDLRRQLDARYRRVVDTSNPEVIPYHRKAGSADYVFLVNDRREYGQYVGQHGRVMENGLPSDAVVTIGRPEGFVYDLVESRTMPVRRENDGLAVDVHLGPCDGKLLMITSKAIAGARIVAPEQVERGRTAACRIEVVDADGQPIDAVVPLEVTIRDPEGRPAEFNGFYGSADGKTEIDLDIAANDRFGVWQVEARELASGTSTVHYFRVPGPRPWPPDGEGAGESAADAVQPNG